MRKIFFMAALAFKGIFAAAQGTPYPGQAPEGPGGAEYAHAEVAFYDHAAEADGYWLFLPEGPSPDTAEVVVFLHGYGAYNPFAYGKWIKHLVARGNIVIYPRYQKNLVFPRPGGFAENAAKGIRDALDNLQREGKTKAKTGKIAYIGHSYGGVIAANLGVNWEKYRVPKPASMLLCEPGTGPLKGGRLEAYSGLPADLQLLVVVGEDDYVVGDEFGQLVFETAVHTPLRNLIVQRRDTSGNRWVLATHSEPYAYDLDFDIGVRNYTANRVLMVSRLNEVDFNCYWKLADALMEYSRHGRYGEIAFGNSPGQRFMGYWSDGKPIRSLDVVLPAAETPAYAAHSPARQRARRR